MLSKGFESFDSSNYLLPNASKYVGLLEILQLNGIIIVPGNKLINYHETTNK